jgi:TonB family protein
LEALKYPFKTMGIRQNIFISIMIHTMIITSAFIVGSSARDTACRVPESYMMVSLFKEMTGITSITSQRTKKGEDKILPPPFPPPRGKRVREGVYMDKIASPEPTLSRKIASPRLMSGLAMTSEGARNDTPANPSNPSATDAIPGNSKASTAISVSRITGQIPSEEFISKSQSGDKILDNTKGGSGKCGADSIYAFIRSAIEKAKTYPFLARKKGIEGTVITVFTINSQGYPKNVRVEKSSGSEILDSAALNIIAKAAPFPRVDGHIVIPITFSLMKNVSLHQND